MRKIAALSVVFLLIFACGEGLSQEAIVDLPQQPDSPKGPQQPDSPKGPQQPDSPKGPQQPDSPKGPQQPDSPKGPQGQGGQRYSDEDREAAKDVVVAASEVLIECFENGFGKIYENILQGYVPDDYEVGIIFACRDNPNSFDSPEGQGGQPQGQQPQGQQPQGQQPQGQQPQGQQPQGQQPQGQQPDYYSLKVTLNNSSYVVATPSSNTRFGLSESADIILSDFGFNMTGGALKFNHPVSIASDGTRLIVVDRFNNRALIWNTIPSSNTNPDIVLGQKNFTTEMHGDGLDNFNFPGQASLTSDGKLLIADSGNNRILVWNSFPTSFGQKASFAIDVDFAGGVQGTWPWGVWSDGTKILVTQTVGGQILIWNTFPTSGTIKPDVVIKSSQVGTPRSITSNGTYIMIGDENANGECIGLNGTRSTHIWTSWPTSSRDPDACVDNWVGGVIVDEKIYAIAAGGETLYFWDSLPTTTNDVSIGMILAGPGEGHRWQGGDDGGMAYANGKLFVGEYNRSLISVFDSIPASPDISPDWALGSASPTDFPLLDDSIIQNPAIASNGEMLFISSDFDRSLSVWKNIPGSSSAKPDIFYRRFENAPWDITVYGNSVFLAGKKGIYGWTNFDGSGELPDIDEWESIGSINFEELFGIAYNGTYFAIAEGKGEKIYIWEGIPSRSDEPVFTLTNPVGVGRLDMNEEWLAIAAYPGDQANVHLIKLSELASGELRAVNGYSNFPQGVSVNEKGLFIALQADNKVVGWDSVEDALSGSSPSMSFGGSTNKSSSGTKMASTVAWDGTYIWVGEFKFSNRLLGFLPSK